VVSAGANAGKVRALLPRPDFELWIAPGLDLTLPEVPGAVERLLEAQRDGTQTVLWHVEAASIGQVERVERALRRTSGPEWAIAEGIEIRPPAGRRSFVLLDTEGRRVRVVLLGSGEDASTVRIGIGVPTNATTLDPEI
jgi:hypothetical protein